MNPSKLLENSGCGYKEPPGDSRNLKQVIQDVPDTEACAIETYSQLTEKYRMTDLVTHELFEESLEGEVEDEKNGKDLEIVYNSIKGIFYLIPFTTGNEMTSNLQNTEFYRFGDLTFLIFSFILDC